MLVVDYATLYLDITRSSENVLLQIWTRHPTREKIECIFAATLNSCVLMIMRSKEVRDLALAHLEDGTSTKEVAKFLKVSDTHCDVGRKLVQ